MAAEGMDEMTTRFRIGTYINDHGSKKWQIGRIRDGDGVGDEDWTLYSMDHETRSEAMERIRIYRAKESHDPQWKEV